MNSHAPKNFVRGFWLLWSAQAISLLGSYAVQFAVIWWLTETTGSATMLATATLIGLLPQVVFGPFIGALIDRWDRKTIMLVSDAGIALVSAFLAWMFLTGNASITLVFVVLAIRSIGGAFHAPSMMASTSLMVPEEHYVRIQGLNQALQNGSPLIAAPLGALLISTMDIGQVLLIDVATALIAITPLLFMLIPKPQRSNADREGSSVIGEVREGLNYLLRFKGALYLVIGASIINFCIVPAFALLPLFVLQELNGDAWLLSYLELIFGAGGILGGSLLATWGGFQQKIKTILLGLVLMGLATVGLGLSPEGTLVLPLMSMALVGVTAAVANGSIMAILQSRIAPEFQGRLFSLMGAVAGAMIPVSLLFAAPIAETLGVRFWYWFGGGFCMLVPMSAVFFPEIRLIESEEVETDARYDQGPSENESQGGQSAHELS